ncbi:MAG TPA: Crp/Fnr family transcriptional regulator [Tenuifilaceae bacterium]|nr:Crp/Fnr family transcriptional regulator [Tenuifilaceae bacterium]HPE17147.1 Crp/Fnr family transcriptional regulator [Tenuifilaceae bacterium]HPJ45875.1 Crp/Fnr family transcriptional regulator [Tenuifilaceae bacterium]HPQ34094.1 Crp/Fnr family transcriptional regulator [Tenuifilaceae bacterium]HRX68735.1 Crp/Fnr family transcriptional regulator [Tenuifilaceae bacterium]
MEQLLSHWNDESIIQGIPFSDLLTETQKQEILETSRIIDYIKRDIILKQSTAISSIPILLKGLVKTSKEMRKGKNIILRIAQPGTFLGISSVFGSDTYSYSVFALEPVTVLFVNAGVLESIIKENGEFGFQIVKRISSNNLFNINKLSSLLYKQLPGRVADIILYFSEQIFKNQTFTIPLTRMELAQLAGTTKESLIRTLSEFNNDKIIEMNRNSITISSLEIIKTLSRLG